MRLSFAPLMSDAGGALLDPRFDGALFPDQGQRMRELTNEEVEQVGGGLWPWVVVGALLLGGCAHTKPLPRGDKPEAE